MPSSAWFALRPRAQEHRPFQLAPTSPRRTLTGSRPGIWRGIRTVITPLTLLLVAGAQSLFADEPVDPTYLMMEIAYGTPYISRSINVEGPASGTAMVATMLGIDSCGLTTGAPGTETSSVSFTSPATLNVVCRANGAEIDNYYGSVSIGVAGDPTPDYPVDVEFTINGPINLHATPSTLSYTVDLGTQSTSGAQVVTLTGTPNLTFMDVSAPDWLTCVSIGQGAEAAYKFSCSILSFTGLRNGHYSSYLNFCPTRGCQQSPVVLKVSVTVNPAWKLDVSPSSLTFHTRIGDPAPLPQQVVFSLDDGVAFHAYADSSWIKVATETHPGQGTVNVSIDNLFSAPATYTGNVFIATTGDEMTKQVPITVVVDPFPSKQVGVTATSLKLTAVSGSSVYAHDSFRVTGPVGYEFGAFQYSGDVGLDVFPRAGTIPADIMVSVNPSKLQKGNYSATMTVEVPTLGIKTTVDVSVNVTGGEVSLSVNPAQLSFAYQKGGALPAPQQLRITGTPGLALDAISPSWLQVEAAAGDPYLLFVRPTGSMANLATGPFSSTITIRTTAEPVHELTVPVDLTVSPSGPLQVDKGDLVFDQFLGGAAPSPQNVVVTGTAGAPLQAAAEDSWLHVSLSAASPPAVLAVSVDAGALPAGDYHSTIHVSAGGSQTLDLPVRYLLQDGGGVTLSPPELRFSYITGSVKPAPGTVQLSSAVTREFTLTTSAPAWLSTSPLSGLTPATLSVAANPGQLPASSYNATVRVTLPANNPSAVLLPVGLNVFERAAFAVAPATVSLACTRGETAPVTSSVSIAGAPAGSAFLAEADSQAGWLSAAPSDAAASNTITLSAVASNLAAGTYTGTVTIRRLAEPDKAAIVPVTLTVADPQTGNQPSFSAVGVVNTASYVAGPVAPGEIVAIFGGKLGPEALAEANIEADNTFAKTAGGTQVLFDGIPAAMLYASAGQVGCMVPYSVAGKATVKVEIEYLGLKSDPVYLAVSQATPALFTKDGSGTGPGAVLNLGLGLNGAENPAPPGSFIILYATGDGEANPASKDGEISGNVITRRTKAPVYVYVGGVPAEIWYAGPAPGSVAGLTQINVKLTPNVPAGPQVPIVLQVGNSPSQDGVTVAIQSPVP